MWSGAGGCCCGIGCGYLWWLEGVESVRDCLSDVVCLVSYLSFFFSVIKYFKPNLLDFMCCCCYKTPSGCLWILSTVYSKHCNDRSEEKVRFVYRI